MTKMPYIPNYLILILLCGFAPKIMNKSSLVAGFKTKYKDQFHLIIWETYPEQNPALKKEVFTVPEDWPEAFRVWCGWRNPARCALGREVGFNCSPEPHSPSINCSMERTISIWPPTFSTCSPPGEPAKWRHEGEHMILWVLSFPS